MAGRTTPKRKAKKPSKGTRAAGAAAISKKKQLVEKNHPPKPARKRALSRPATPFSKRKGLSKKLPPSHSARRTRASKAPSASKQVRKKAPAPVRKAPREKTKPPRSTRAAPSGPKPLEVLKKLAPLKPLTPGKTPAKRKGPKKRDYKLEYKLRMERLITKKGYTRSQARGHARLKKGELSIAEQERLAQGYFSKDHNVRIRQRSDMLKKFGLPDLEAEGRFFGRREFRHGVGYGPRDWHNRREKYERIAAYNEKYFGVERNETFHLLFSP